MIDFPVITSTLSAKELGEFVIEQYSLSKQLQCNLFRSGINHTYFLTNKEIKYVIRVYSHKWRSKREINAELKLLKLLKTNEIAISYPLKDRIVQFIQEINAPEGIRYIVLFSFAEGEKLRHMNHKTLTYIGSLMGRFHKLTMNTTIERKTYNKQSLLEQPYQKLLHFFSNKLPEMEFIKNFKESFNDSDYTHLNSGIMHMDLWYDNMSVANEKEITLFDFDFCGNGTQLLDVAYFCKQLFFIETDKSEYEIKVKRFLDGYQNIKTLSKSELDLIPVFGASIFIFYLGVQAQRFDWSNIFLTENYLKMYIGRIKSWLSYHNLSETLSVYK
ncbi:phosphotransferase [Maribacter hydrothermalis]|uniref:Homoserine kinase n=1 Tax=Maribacter hydrothermalis TaxID=1836467 RepID=A0A1B7Z865_9FLAO|nr:phosphotransferase [Maribacter hydrothermalis]APQ19112.1 homoserine kinase [Maribacter hydrothermalis]OBR38876.1 homoserine kinase [Maribacter hydrothermalis]